jgi:hypothetical protein
MYVSVIEIIYQCVLFETGYISYTLKYPTHKVAFCHHRRLYSPLSKKYQKPDQLLGGETAGVVYFYILQVGK